MHSRRIAGIAACVLVASCGSDQDPDPDIPAELVGNWVAQPACSPDCEFTFTMVDDPSQSVDIITALNFSVDIGIAASGAFTLDFSGGTGPETGTVRVEGSRMLVRDNTGVTDTINWHIANELLYLDFEEAYTVLDIDQDGALDASIAAGVFARRE
jgi:nitrous oxide reductase accessory protein NosL